LADLWSGGERGSCTTALFEGGGSAPVASVKGTFHRLPTTARGIDQSALRLTETLNDPLRSAQLEELYHEIDSKIKAMELNKNVLEDELDAQLREIQRQRAELDRKEKDLKATTLRKDVENKALIGHLLEEALQKIFDEKLMSRADLRRIKTNLKRKQVKSHFRFLTACGFEMDQ
jgi:hypothetical protein